MHPDFFRAIAFALAHYHKHHLAPALSSLLQSVTHPSMGGHHYIASGWLPLLAMVAMVFLVLWLLFSGRRGAQAR